MMFPVTDALISWRPATRIFRACVSSHLSVCAAAPEAASSGPLVDADLVSVHLRERGVKPAGAPPVRGHSFSLEAIGGRGHTRGDRQQLARGQRKQWG